LSTAFVTCVPCHSFAMSSSRPTTAPGRAAR
jgi:hypothetical protein